MITLITLPISAEEAPSWLMVADVAAVTVTASAATRAASAAFWEISRIEAPISSLPADTVSTLREICSAAADTFCACADVSSADAAIWVGDAGQLLGGAGQRRRRNRRWWPHVARSWASRDVQGLAHLAGLVAAGQAGAASQVTGGEAVADLLHRSALG